MGDPLRPSEKAILLERYHQRRGKHVQRTSPKEAFEEEYRDTDARCREAAQAYCRAGSVVMDSIGDVSSNPYFKEQSRLIKHLEELDSTRVTVRNKESEYQQRLEQELVDDFLEHLNLLGTSICTRVFHEWLAAQQTQRTPVEKQVEERDRSADMYLEVTPIAALPTSDIPRVDDEACDPDILINEQELLTESTSKTRQGKQPEPPGSKRKRPTAVSRRKRRPPPKITNKVLTTNSIEFSEVYQDGNALQKYVIAKYRQNWYIVECKEHQLEFRTRHPLLGAIKHFRAQEHNPNGNDTDMHMAIAKFGTLVKNCNSDLAAMNNEVAIARVSHDHVDVPQRSLRAHPDAVEVTEDNIPSAPSTSRCRTALPLNPQPGDVYKSYWGSNYKCYYAALILPQNGTFDEAGLKNRNMSLKDSPLLKVDTDIPECYEYDKDSGFLEWAEGYEPGGSKASQQEYPVVWFDNQDCLRCSYGWVSVVELETYRLGDTNVEFFDNVTDFLRGRDLSDDIGEATDAGSQACNGDDVTEPTAGSQGGPETFHNHPPALQYPSPAAEQSSLRRSSSPSLDENDSEFERSLAAQTRENSLLLKDKVAEPDPMDTPRVPIRNKQVRASEQSIMQSQEKQDSQTSDPGPVSEQNDYYMDVDSRDDTANDDTMPPTEGRITHDEYQAILNGTYSQSNNTSLRDPMRPQAKLANMSVDTESRPGSTEAPISHNTMANPVLQHIETDLHDFMQGRNVARWSLHDVFAQMNRHTTVEAQGAFERTVRSDGGSMWTLGQTPDGIPSRAL